jgi:hypothetical protein
MHDLGPTVRKALILDRDRSALMQICECWNHDSPKDAKRLAEECLARADALALVAGEYCWGDRASTDPLRFVLETVHDLTALAWDQLQWWTIQDKDPTQDGTPQA